MLTPRSLIPADAETKRWPEIAAARGRLASSLKGARKKSPKIARLVRRHILAAADVIERAMKC